MLAYGMSDKGPVRPVNEDSFDYGMIGNCLCMVVADGVGGEACGEIASRIAVYTVFLKVLFFLGMCLNSPGIGFPV